MRGRSSTTSFEARWSARHGRRRADAFRRSPGGAQVCTRPTRPHAASRRNGTPARVSTTKDVEGDRFKAVAEAVGRSGAVVLLKGARTLVGAPSVLTAVNPSGCAALATAGSGDVLSGICGAFFAALGDPFHAACAAAFVHGTVPVRRGLSNTMVRTVVFSPTRSRTGCRARLPGWRPHASCCQFDTRERPKRRSETPINRPFSYLGPWHAPLR